MLSEKLMMLYCEVCKFSSNGVALVARQILMFRYEKRNCCNLAVHGQICHKFHILDMHKTARACSPLLAALITYCSSAKSVLLYFKASLERHPC